MADQGSLHWPYLLKDGNFYLAGFNYTGFGILPTGSGGAGGHVFEMASGGVRHQRTPSQQYAPSLAGVTLPFSWVMNPTLTEAARRRIELAAGLAGFGKVLAAPAVPITDIWVLEGDSRTVFTTSHQMPAGTLGYIAPLLAEILNRDGTVSQALTIVTSGPPTATEVQVDAVSDSDQLITIATGPGAAGNAGKLFAFTYYPLLTVASLTHEWATDGGTLVDTVSFEAAAYQKDWAADAP